MANPQLEDGFTRISNEILEALIRTRIPGEARQCLDLILRKTYGWKGKHQGAQIPLSQFVEATSIKKPNIKRALRKLQAMNLIFVIQKDNDLAVSYQFNKDYDTWRALSKKITVIQKDNKALSKKIPSKDTLKEKKQQPMAMIAIIAMRAQFKAIRLTAGWKVFWGAYLQRDKKQDAMKAWRKLDPSLDLAKKILADVRRRFKHDQDWIKEGYKFAPRAGPYLNQRRWEDETAKKKAPKTTNEDITRKAW